MLIVVFQLTPTEEDIAEAQDVIAQGRRKELAEGGYIGYSIARPGDSKKLKKLLKLL